MTKKTKKNLWIIAVVIAVLVALFFIYDALTKEDTTDAKPLDKPCEAGKEKDANGNCITKIIPDPTPAPTPTTKPLEVV